MNITFILAYKKFQHKYTTNFRFTKMQKSGGSSMKVSQNQLESV